MPYKNPEKRKECKKRWAEKNKQKVQESKKRYQEKNKHKLYEKKQSPECKKNSRIYNWKHSGVIHQNFDELYEKYINTEYCELCSVKLTVDKRTTSTTRCLDHDHSTGLVRNIVCHSCNSKLPRQKGLTEPEL